jgi:hypothetical protein
MGGCFALSADLDALDPGVRHDIFYQASCLGIWVEHLTQKGATCPRGEVVNGRGTSRRSAVGRTRRCVCGVQRV